MNQQPDEEIHWARFPMKDLCPHRAWVPSRWHTEAFWFPNVEVPWKMTEELSLWVFMRLYYVVMIKSLATGDWLNLKPPSPPWKSGEDSNPLTTGLVPTSSHPWVGYKSHLIDTTRDTTVALIILQNSKRFGSCEPRIANENQIYLKIYIYICIPIYTYINIYLIDHNIAVCLTELIF